MKNTMDYLTIALPKGKLFSLSADLLAKAGYTAEGLSDKSRKLVIANEEKKIRFIVSKSSAPLNARRSVVSSYRQMPSAKMSLRRSICLPLHCSGDM